MKILPLARGLAAVALTAASAAPALADTVNLGLTYTPAKTLTVTAASAVPAITNKNFLAGQFSGTLTSGMGTNAFVTFCTELTQTFSLNTNISGYSIQNAQSGPTAWANPAAMNHLMSYWQNNQPSDATSSAVFQAAVWEVVYEKPSNGYNFASGDFTASGDAGVNSALGLWSWSTVLSTSITRTVDRLYHPTSQNFLVTTPVPEPESYAMMLAGLSLVGAIARRRRSSAN
ncbi:MAG: hypothetical protein FAZ92_03750 [Accumulibacter sp.]|uniref:PEP-CTERM sorting domain-containing protein n=1 Tax=Accumulibacter sp. TaxID=2053492 RepID=UPI0011F52E80|nr:PEP-CTERM sorting domain-containing protein [Accumulibacter sp.]TLD43977.1 MAG: hypothetical protein FAZ92_03750 [Accumulibacter sp.]